MRVPAMVPDPPGDGSGDSYTFHYLADNDDQPLLAIVESVAWVKGVDARELEPLHYAIDVETLSELLRGRRRDFARGADQPSSLTVKFRYEGCLVMVTPEEVTVEPG